jgi:hypothetical protein
MNDDTTLTEVRNGLAEVRDSLSGVHMSVPAAEIVARARGRRVRRLLSAAAACAAAGLAAALVLPPGSQPRPVHVNLAAWSVNTHPDGTVTFRLRDTTDPGRLQQVLADAGVPAMVRWGEICLAQGRHELLPTWGFLIGPGQQRRLGSVLLLYRAAHGTKVLNWSWTITPAKIPGGAHFVISAKSPGQVAPGGLQAEWEFVPFSAHVICR